MAVNERKQWTSDLIHHNVCFLLVLTIRLLFCTVQMWGTANTIEDNLDDFDDLVDLQMNARVSRTEK